MVEINSHKSQLDTDLHTVKNCDTVADAAGALLLRAGAIGTAALAQAMELKQREGGTLGEALVRLGLIEEERLVSVFQQSLMIPRIPLAVLQRLPRETLALLPPALALAHRVLPVELDTEGNLTLAMMDPTDNAAVDAVAAHTGRFVMRAVAAPAMLRDALAFYYEEGAARAESRAPERTAPAPSPVPSPVPSKERATSRPRVRNTLPPTAKVVPEQSVPPAPPPSAALRALTRAVTGSPPKPEPRVEEGEARPARRGRNSQPKLNAAGEGKGGKTSRMQIKGARPVRIAEPGASEPILLDQPVAPQTGSTLPGVGGAPDQSLLAPVARLRAAATRDEVVAVLLDYASLLAARVGLFVVQKGQLVCLDGRGPDHVVVAMKWFTIPVDTPSPFRDVLQSRKSYIGSLEDTAESRAFRNALGSTTGRLLLLPLTVGDRVVGVLYADEIHTDLGNLSTELETLSREAGAAFARIILSRKQ